MRRTAVRRLPEGGPARADGRQGRELVDRLGHLVGRIEALFADEETEWAAVRMGLPCTRRSMVPMGRARPLGERIRVPFDKEHIVRSPRLEFDGTLDGAAEARLYRHYGMGPSMTRPGDRPTATPSASTPAGAMTRSEEELRVGTAHRVRARVRVRKYVVTEEVQYTIPLRREEISIESFPVADEDAVSDAVDPEASIGQLKIVLHEEVPVIEKRVVPRERVRVIKEAQTHQAEVTEELRRERIETEVD